MAAAIAGILLLASPAFASTQSLTLNPAHKDQTAAGFKGGDDCDAPFTKGMDSDGWHFIWQQGGSFLTADLTFKNGANNIVVHVAGAAGVVNSDLAQGWSAFFEDTGGPDPKIKHLYVFTPPGWTLVDGVGTGENGSGTVFNLSHTCAGDGPPCTENCTPPPPPCTQGCEPPPCPDAGCPEPPCDEAAGDVCSPTDPGTPAPTTPVDEESLPTTGSSLTGVIVAGAALVGAGVGTLLFLRRRRDTTAS
jgi:LPXTG-motif cell wall-anchored protein